MHHWRPTCIIGDRHASSKTEMHHRRPKCLIKDSGLQWVSYQACRSPIRHVGLRLGMSVSDKAFWSPIRHVTQWVSDNNNIFVNSKYKYNTFGNNKIYADYQKLKHTYCFEEFVKLLMI